MRLFHCISGFCSDLDRNGFASELEAGKLIVSHRQLIRGSPVIRSDFDFLNEVVPLHLWILFVDCEQVDERSNSGTRCAEVAFAQTLAAMLHKRRYRFVGQQVLCRIARGVNITKVEKQDIEVFWCKGSETNHRP